MNISRKVILAVSSILPIFAIVVIILLKVYVAPQFVETEKTEMLKNLSMGTDLLQREINSVSTYCTDYSNWDDTYDFMVHPNSKYLNSNYEPSYIVQLKINLVCILDLKGNARFVRFVDDSATEMTLSDMTQISSDVRKIIDRGINDREENIKGIVETNFGFMLFASHPITDSATLLPPRGRMLVGRLIHRNDITEIDAILRSKIEMHSAQKFVSKNISDVLQKISEINSDWVSVEGEEIKGYHLIRDFNGFPCVVLSITAPMIFAEKGLGTVNMVIIVLILLGGFVISLIILYLKINVLQPMSTLAEKTDQIAATSDFSERLPIYSGDEVGILGRSFNRLLDVVSDVNSTLEQKVHDRTQALEQSNRELTLLGKVFENSLEGIMITDYTGIIREINPAYTKITGYLPEEIIGRHYSFRKSDRHDENFYGMIKNTVDNEGRWSGELWSRHKKGRVFPEWLSISTITDSNGSLLNYLFVFHDISDAKQQESYIKYQAYHDNLTGLPNRTLLYQRMEDAIKRFSRTGKRLALLFLDLDKFKNINDSLGHEYGDVLLQHVSERLQKLVRVSDTVSRLGGDEFVIMLEDITEDNQPETLAERIIKSFDDPFVVIDKMIHIGTSIGITVFPKDGEDVGTLIKNADTAMYRAKEDGRQRYHSFTMELNVAVAKKQRLETELRMAIVMNQFEVHYQPKVNAESGLVEGFEGLTRWHLDGNIISPADFIPLAEETGLIVSLDRIILENACSEIAAMNRKNGTAYRLALNSSAQALRSKGFPDEIAMVMEKTGMRPEWLEIEITETELMRDIDSCIAVLKRIADLGISIAMDDFGTGYSSLSQLNRIPLDVLKIDRSFIEKIDEAKSNVSLVDNVLSMAKNLNLKVVAEGVENSYQLDYLKNLGCDLIQGYLFSRPLPLSPLQEYLNSMKK